MSDLSFDEVRAIARLARLRLDDEHIERLRGELSGILEHMAVLGELDTSGVEPMTHAVPMAMRLRDDAVAGSLPTERALGGAPHDDDSFEVPGVLEAGE